MLIDHALILSAGMGSRMGEIGKYLPKPLWPIFCKNLLELQFDYCRDLGIERIFVNTHFLSEKIIAYVKNDKKFHDVIILHEDPLLNSGGAIHNMASRGDVNYKGNLLTVNADQFLFFESRYFSDALLKLRDSRASLFGIRVDKKAKYNEVIVADGLLKNITLPTGKEDYVTYSGLGLIKLDGLIPVAGATKFFETVVNYNREKISFITPESFEYWDFGTADIYLESIRKIFHEEKSSYKSAVISFLKKHGAFLSSGDNFYSAELDSVNLEGQGHFEKKSIVGLGIVQSV